MTRLHPACLLHRAIRIQNIRPHPRQSPAQPSFTETWAYWAIWQIYRLPLLCPYSSVPLWLPLLEGADLNFDSYIYVKAWVQQESPLPLSAHLRLRLLPGPGSLSFLFPSRTYIFAVSALSSSIIFSSPVAPSPSFCLQIRSSNQLTKLCYSFSKYGLFLCISQRITYSCLHLLTLFLFHQLIL